MWHSRGVYCPLSFIYNALTQQFQQAYLQAHQLCTQMIFLRSCFLLKFAHSSASSYLALLLILLMVFVTVSSNLCWSHWSPSSTTSSQHWRWLIIYMGSAPSLASYIGLVLRMPSFTSPFPGHQITTCCPLRDVWQASSTALNIVLLYILYYTGCPAAFEDRYILRGYDETVLHGYDETEGKRPDTTLLKASYYPAPLLIYISLVQSFPGSQDPSRPLPT